MADRKTTSDSDLGTAGTGTSLASTTTAVSDQLKTGGDKLAGQAADKARGFVAQGLERSSEALSNAARMIGDTADGIDERIGSDYGDYARKASTSLDKAAKALADKSPDELIDDTRDFVRKSPGLALAGAAVVGFVLARLVKNGLDSGRGDRA